MTHSLAEHGLSDIQGISVNWSLAQRPRLLDGTFSAMLRALLKEPQLESPRVTRMLTETVCRHWVASLL